jgi:hypothetical protein
MGKCLHTVGIYPEETIDDEGKEMTMLFPIGYHQMMANDVKYWFHKNPLHNITPGIGEACCSFDPLACAFVCLRIIYSDADGVIRAHVCQLDESMLLDRAHSPTHTILWLQVTALLTVALLFERHSREDEDPHTVAPRRLHTHSFT